MQQVNTMGSALRYFELDRCDLTRILSPVKLSIDILRNVTPVVLTREVRTSEVDDFSHGSEELDLPGSSQLVGWPAQTFSLSARVIGPGRACCWSFPKVGLGPTTRSTWTGIA